VAALATRDGLLAVLSPSSKERATVKVRTEQRLATSWPWRSWWVAGATLAVGESWATVVVQLLVVEAAARACG